MQACLNDESVMQGFVGVSPQVQRLRAEIARLAAHDVSILLQGETGTGKELVAHLLHRLSVRCGGPFIGVNCVAIHETLLESVLFGHEAGAFTGARHATQGFFRAADGGTILLDEVGDMGGALQSKLLRVLEDGKVRRIGSSPRSICRRALRPRPKPRSSSLWPNASPWLRPSRSATSSTRPGPCCPSSWRQSARPQASPC